MLLDRRHPARRLGAEMKQSALGARLRELREERNLGLRELARRTGVSPSFLSEIESGRRSPSDTVLEKLTAELEVGSEELRTLHAGKIAGDLKDLMESDTSWVPVLFKLAEKARQRALNPAAVSNWLTKS